MCMHVCICQSWATFIKDFYFYNQVVFHLELFHIAHWHISLNTYTYISYMYNMNYNTQYVFYIYRKCDVLIFLIIPRNVNVSCYYVWYLWIYAITSGSSSEKPRITGLSSSSEIIKVEILKYFLVKINIIKNFVII